MGVFGEDARIVGLVIVSRCGDFGIVGGCGIACERDDTCGGDEFSGMTINHRESSRSEGHTAFRVQIKYRISVRLR